MSVNLFPLRLEAQRQASRWPQENEATLLTPEMDLGSVSQRP